MTKPVTRYESAVIAEMDERRDGFHCPGSRENKRFWKRWIVRIRRNFNKRVIREEIS